MGRTKELSQELKDNLLKKVDESYEYFFIESFIDHLRSDERYYVESLYEYIDLLENKLIDLNETI